MFSLGRIFLIVAVTSFLAPSFCPGMSGGCKENPTISASDCRLSQTSHCCKHSCCKFTKHSVVSKVRDAALNNYELVFSPLCQISPTATSSEFLFFHPKIHTFYHPEFSQVLRL